MNTNIKTKLAILLMTVASVFPVLGQEAPKATVLVYRPASIVGSALKPSIYCDGKELQRLRNRTFFSASVEPGKHMITAGRSEVGQFVDFEPGKHYFIRFGHKNWVGTAVSGRQPITLTVVTEDEARSELHGLKDASR